MSLSGLRGVVAAILVTALVPAALVAQVVAGTVVDSASRRPLAGVTVIVRSVTDTAAVRGSVTDSTGRFSVPLPKADTVTVTVRRIGLQPLSTPPRAIHADSVRRFAFEVTPLPQLLDTVRTEGTKYLRGLLYKLVAGQEWFARHLREGKGFFTSGQEIELSGMDPCDYLGRLPDFQISDVVPFEGFGIGCYEGGNEPVRYVVPRRGGCLQPAIDKELQLVGVSKSYFLVATPGQSKVRWYPIEAIRGIEIYGKYEDRPKDFSNSLRALRLSVYGNDPDFSAPLTLARAGSVLEDATMQRCALMLIWTTRYWGD